ncbi:MAG: L-histidine N(alpha)-methyltransferase [Propionibacteriales bacterium]|nr:L-histidine N(alpha)-methyltransferase [Propionibacteriales bacterium]
MSQNATTPTIDVHLSAAAATQALRSDALKGLTATPKWLPPKWFYDKRGSELFDLITMLPEYYPARAEREILETHGADIARRTDARALVELGSGLSVKTRLLLDALRRNGSLRHFVPLDVSVAALTASVDGIAADYPGLVVHGIVGDFTEHLAELPHGSPRLVAFLGGTIGNLLPVERASFLSSVRAALVPGEWLLLGTDLVKDPETLIRAYDDEAGVTAEFNRNVLHVINRELGGDFDVAAFTHRAVWDSAQEWIEMRLVAQREMLVSLPGIERSIVFESGEQLRTEVSAKFTRERVEWELASAGFSLDTWWTDTRGRFALSLARAV